ncbi:MAG: SWIM zinc finger family protein [Alphaproteobacteria bacterium]|nr:SWIM zinc finger family protein [Alphaproteobacteria bacterium]
MLTRDKVEALAPDKSSLDAALKLVKASGWPLLAVDEQRTLAWGECQGSGATPYRVCVSLADVGYRCTCPSRKFPCKHVLAVLLIHIDQQARFATGEPADWVRDWLARRRKTSSAPPATANQGDAKPDATSATASNDPPPTVTPTDPAKLEAQRRRQREAREAKILDGLSELDQWLLDQLKAGIGDFAQASSDRCRTAARRLADAQAPGLASLIDQIPGDMLKLRPEQRADFIVEQLGTVHLLAEAYRKQDKLPELLRHDIRRAIGWNVKRDELLLDPNAPRSAGRWIVTGARSIVQADALRRVETWLARRDADQAGQFACLIDFVPASMGTTGSSFYPGEEIEAHLVYYPSAMPLRAVLAEHKSASPMPTPMKHHHTLSAALDHWDDVLAAQPFLHEWPFGVTQARVVAADRGLAVTDAAGASVLPLAEAQEDAATPLLGLDSLDVTGLWNGRTFTLMLAETPLGRWVAA